MSICCNPWTWNPEPRTDQFRCKCLRSANTRTLKIKFWKLINPKSSPKKSLKRFLAPLLFQDEQSPKARPSHPICNIFYVQQGPWSYPGTPCPTSERNFGGLPTLRRVWRILSYTKASAIKKASWFLVYHIIRLSDITNGGDLKMSTRLSVTEVVRHFSEYINI